MNVQAWIRTAWQVLAGRDATSETAEVRDRLFADLDVMRLEPRLVLNGDGVTTELVVDTGSSADDGSSDQIDVLFQQDHVEVSVNGIATQRSSLHDVDSVVLRGSSDQDRFRLRNPLGIPGGIDVLVDGAGGNDQLVFERLEQIEKLVHLLDAPGAGQVEWLHHQTTAELRYQRVEHVIHDGGTNSIEVHGGEGIDEIDVDAAGVGEGKLRLTAAGTVDPVDQTTRVDFAAPSETFRIDVASAPSDRGDRLVVDGFQSPSGADLVLLGDANDQVTFRGTTQLQTGNLHVEAGRVEIEGTVFGTGSTLDIHGGTSTQILASGQVEMDSGFVSLRGGSVVVHGTVQSRGGGVHLESSLDGETRLSGAIDVSDSGVDGLGGSVRVLGWHVDLSEGSRIDASGTAGGGTVLIGGDYQGRNPDVLNARRTRVANSAFISARAARAGDGGRVIVWADDATRFEGTIDARGGETSGDGGFAEVSGKRRLHYAGAVDLTAANGTSGSLLLDPDHIVVNNPGSAATTDVDEYSDPGAVSEISVATIVAALDTANVVLQAHSTITIERSIDATGNTNDFDLILSAGQSIFIQDDVSLRGNFIATANDNSGDSAERDDGAADFVMDDGVTIDTSLNDANISITVANGYASADDFAGSITIERLNAGAGNVTIQNAGAVDGSSILRDADTTTASSIIGNQVAMTVTDGATNVSGSVGTALDPMTITAATLIAQAQHGGVFIEDTGGVTLADVDSGTAGVHIQSTGAIRVTDVLAIGPGAGEGAVVLTAGSGDITLDDNAISAGTGGVSLTASAGAILEADVTTIAKIETAGTLTLSAGGGIGSTNGDEAIDVSVAGIAAETVTSGSVVVAEADALAIGAGNGVSGITAAAGGDVVIHAGGLLSLNAGHQIVAGGDGTTLELRAAEITVGAGTAISPTLQNSGSGTINLQSTGGNIALDDHSLAAQSGSVTLDAGTSNITVANATTAAEMVTGGSLTLTAAAIGATNTLDLEAATSLTIFDTGIGTIRIAERSASTILHTAITVGDSGYGSLEVDYHDLDAIQIGDDHAITDVAHQHSNRSFQYLAVSGDITLGQVNAGTADLILTATSGSISEATPNTTTTITAANLTLSSGTGIGGATGDAAIDLNVTTLAAEATTSGGIFLIESDGLTVQAGAAGVTGINTNGGAIDLVSTAGDVQVTADVVAGTGDVTFSADNLLIDASVSGNNLDLNATVLINVSAGNQLLAGGAGTTLSVSAATLDVRDGTLNTETIRNADGGAIVLLSTSGDVLLGDHAVASGSGNVEIRSAGLIDESADSDVVNVSTSGSLLLEATGSIGAGGGVGIVGTGPLDLQVGSLTARSTVAGGLFLKTAGTITLSDIDTVNGDIQIGSTGSMDVIDLDAGASVVLIANSGDITLADAAIVTSGGNVQLAAGGGSIRETVSSNATKIQTAGVLELTASGDVGGASGDAAIDVNVSSLAAASTTGGVFLASLSDLVIATAPSGLSGITSGGDVVIETAAALSVTAPSRILGGGDGTSIIVSADTITVSAGTPGSETIHNTGSGQISLTAASGNLVLPDHAIRTGSGEVRLSATGGSIIEAIANTTASVTTSGGLALTASAEIGSAATDAALDTAVGSLAASAGTGGVYVRDSGSLRIDTAAAVTGIESAGTIALESTGGNFVVDQRVRSAAGNVVLTGQTFAINANVEGQFVTLNASGSVSLSGGAQLIAGGSGTTLSITADSMTLGAGTAGNEALRNAGSGNVDLTILSGDIQLLEHAVGSDSGDVTIVAAAGAVLNASATVLPQISTSGTVTLSADTGIGSLAAAIRTDVGTLAARTVTGGGIFLGEADGIVIGSGAAGINGLTTAGGDVQLSSNGNTTRIAADVNAGTGSVVLDVDTLEVDANVSASSINLDASGNAAITSGAQIIGGGAGTTITVIAAGLDVGGGAAANETIKNSGTGTITLTATTGNVTLGDFAVGSGLGQVTIDAGAGDLIVANPSAAAEVIASGDLRITASAVGAAANPLRLDGPSRLSLVDAGAGNIHVQELTAATITSTEITVGNVGFGSIEVDYFDADQINIQDNHLIAGVVHSNSNRRFRYQATAGDITINDFGIAVGSADVDILADAGAIGEASAGSTTNIQTTGTLSIQAGGNVGSGSGNAALDIAAGSLAARSVGGDLFFRSAAATTIASGNLGFDGLITAGGDIDVAVQSGVLSIAGGIQAGGGTVELNASQIDVAANVSGGSVTATASGDVTIAAGNRIAGGGDGTAVAVRGSVITIGTGTAANAGVQNTGTGTVAVTATAGQINLSNHSIRGGSGTVTINADAGQIAVAQSTATREIVASGAVAITAGTIGSATNPLDIQGATSLSLTDIGTGAMFLREVSANTITNLSVANLTGVFGTIDIDYHNGDRVDIDDGHVLTAIDHAGFNRSFSYLATAGDLSVGQIDTGSGDVSLTTLSGNITETGSDPSIDITTSGVLTLSTTSGIGGSAAGQALDIAASTLAANTFSGGVFLNQSGDLIIGAGSGGVAGITTTLGPIVLDTQAASLTIDRAVTALLSDVQLTGGTMDINADVFGLNVDINAGGNVDIQAGSRVVAGGNGTTLSLQAAGVTVGAGSFGTETIKNSATGTVSLTTSGGDVSLDRFAIGGGSGDVTVAAGTGRITVASATSDPEIAAVGNLFVAAAEIGNASNVLGMQAVTSLTLVDTGAGDMFLAEIGGNSIASLDVTVGDEGFGGIDLDYGNTDRVDIDDDHRIQQVQQSGGNREFTYTASNGDVRLGGGGIDTGTSNTTLTATNGAIVEATADTSTKINTTGTVTLSAATGIGSAAADASIDVQAGTLAAQTISSGGIHLSETDGVIVGNGDGGVVGLVAAGGGDISLDVAGNATFQANVSGHNIDLQISGVATVAGGHQIIAAGDGTSLNLQAGAIDLAVGAAGNETIRNSGTGTIRLASTAGNIHLRNHAAATGSGSVTLDAQSGGIGVTNLFAAPHVSTGGELRVTASTVGTPADPLNVAGASSLSVTDTGSGDIHLFEFGAVTIAATSITVDGSAAGAIQINYADADRVAIASGHQINSVEHSASQRAFEYTAGNGDVLVADNAIATGNAAVTLRALAGSIVDGGSGVNKVVSSGTVTLSASGSVGGTTPGDEFDLIAGVLAARSTGNGVIGLNVTGSTTIGSGADSISGLTVAGSGDILIAATNTVTIQQAVVANDGDVRVAANDLDVDADIRGSNVELDASGNLDVASGARVVGGGDGTTVSIDAQAIVLHSGFASDPTVENSGSGSVRIRSLGQDIALDPNSIGGGTGLLSIDAGIRRIDVLIPTRTAEIWTSGPVELTASGIGTGSNPLEIAGATSLRINDTGGGDIFVAESIAASLASIDISVASLGHGAIELDFFGTDAAQIADNHLLASIDIDEATRSLTYTAGAGDVFIGSIRSGSGALTLTSNTGAILDDPINASTDMIAGGPVTLTAAGSIGLPSQPISTQVQSLSAVTTVNGGVFIEEVDGLNIGAGGSSGISTAGGGDVQVVSATGNLIVGQAVQSGTGDVRLESDTLTIQAPIVGHNVDLVADQSLDFISQRVIAGGDGTQLSIIAPQVVLPSSIGGAETLFNSGTGGVNVTATTGDVTLADHSIATGTGVITVQAAAGSITENQPHSVGAIRSAGLLQLDAFGSIGASGSPLDVSVDSLTARSLGSGGVFVRDADGVTLLGLLSNDGDIEVNSSATVTGAQPITTVTGDVALQADRINLLANGDISALSGSIRLSTVQLNGLSLQNATRLTTGQGSVSGRLFNAANPFAGSSDVGGSLTDSNRQATINVVLADDQATNVGIEIDWNEGEPVTPIPVVPPQNLRARVVAADLASGVFGGTFSHIYEEPPDPNDPSADININLRITELANGTIQVQTAGQSVLTSARFAAQSLTIDVSAPILPFFFTLPQVDRLEQFVVPEPVVVQPTVSERIVVSETPLELNNSIGTAQESSSRYYVLRVVSFGDEGEVRLIQQGQEYRLRNLQDPDSEHGFELSQLPELFKRLPDDRYRIYMIDGQTERLVLDFIIRDGQPVEAQQDDVQARRNDAASGEVTDAESTPEAKQASPQSTDDPPGGVADQLGRAPIVSSGGILLSASMLPRAARPINDTPRQPLKRAH